MVARFFQIQTELSADACGIQSVGKGLCSSQAFQPNHGLAARGGNNMLRVQEIFDTMLEEDYPELSGHLAADTEIVENVEFERAVVKIAKGLILTEERRESVRGLLLPAASVATGTVVNATSITVSNEVELSYA